MIPLLVLFQLFTPVDPAGLAKFHEARIAALEKGSAAQRAAVRDYGLFWLKNGQPAQAETLLRSLGPDPESAVFLAEAVAAQGREREAEALFGACRGTARCLTRLAQMADARGDAAGALGLYREALDVEPNGSRRNDLAQAMQAAGKLREAEALYRVAAKELEQQRGAEHPETAITWNNLASLLLATDRAAEAEVLQRKAYAIMQRKLGPRHVRTGLAASNLADIVQARGRRTEAVALYRRALAIFEEVLPAGHPWAEEARQAISTR